MFWFCILQGKIFRNVTYTVPIIKYKSNAAMFFLMLRSLYRNVDRQIKLQCFELKMFVTCFFYPNMLIRSQCTQGFLINKLQCSLSVPFPTFFYIKVPSLSSFRFLHYVHILFKVANTVAVVLQYYALHTDVSHSNFR